MTHLNRMHPTRLLLGAVIVAEERATLGRQMTLASLCHDAIGWAVETRDLLREIACDAANGKDSVRRISADGKITPVEAGELIDEFSEIERQALTGKIE